MKEKEIKEIHQHISNALEQWVDIMNKADADEWAYYIDYSDKDLFNALYIFNHVAQNIAIKSNFIKDEQDAQLKTRALRKQIKESFGFDTVELTNKVLKK